MDFSDRISDDNIRTLVFIAELWQGDRFVTRQTAGFAPIKHLSLADPAVTVDLRSEKGQLIIELTSRSLALLVEVSLTGADVVFSDNYFNLPAWSDSPDFLPAACRLDSEPGAKSISPSLRLRLLFTRRCRSEYLELPNCHLTTPIADIGANLRL